jgi:hypothetical protein
MTRERTRPPNQRTDATANRLNHLMTPKCLSTSEPAATISTDPPAAPPPTLANASDDQDCLRLSWP